MCCPYIIVVIGFSVSSAMQASGHRQNHGSWNGTVPESGQVTAQACNVSSAPEALASKVSLQLPTHRISPSSCVLQPRSLTDTVSLPSATSSARRPSSTTDTAASYRVPSTPLPLPGLPVGSPISSHLLSTYHVPRCGHALSGFLHLTHLIYLPTFRSTTAIETKDIHSF
jgi:hypothetical protein